MTTTKSLLMKVAVALLIPVGAHANDIGGTAADPENNQEFQDVYLTKADIIIDGDLSDWTFYNPIVDPLIGIPKIGQGGRLPEDEPTDYVIHEVLGGNWTGPDDQSSSTQFVWKSGADNIDDAGLYMAIVVTDDYHGNAASGWNGDSAQMMVTYYDSDFMEHDPNDFALYNFALDGFEDELDPEDPLLVLNFERAFSFFSSPQDYTQVAITRDVDTNQTVYEIFLGADALGLDASELVEGAQLGIAMAINDGDEDIPGQTGWVGLGAHAIVFGKTPGEAAVLTLGPEFSGPTCNPNTSGDLDGNGAVEFADFLVLSANFGSQVSGHQQGDVDCNGAVEFADFLVLSANFGQNVAGAASVPEPSASGLLGVGLLIASIKRRRTS